MTKRTAQTIKKSKSALIVGLLTVGIVVLLAVYFILIATGVISAAPNKLTIATAGLSVEYDGKEHSVDKWQITGGELLSEHTLSVTVTGKRTEAGVGKNTVEYTITDGRGYDVTDTYDVELDLGDIEILPRSLIVSSATAEKEYDGTPLVARECKLERGTLVEGHNLEFFVTGTLTASGKTNNEFTALVFDGDRNVTQNYDMEYLYGVLHVVGELIEISTPSAQKTYDGTPLTRKDYSVTSGHTIDGDSFTVTVTGEQTLVGESDNKATFKATSTLGADATAKYEVIFSFGVLTVNPIEILIETRSDYKVYDAKSLVADGWRIVCDETLAGDIWYTSNQTQTYKGLEVSLKVVGALTDSGVAENEAVFVTVTRNGADASDFVKISYRLGSLTVLPRPLTVMSGSKSKKFDGTPLTFDNWELVKGVYGVCDGQTLYVTVSGTITYVGTEPNTIAEAVIFDKDGRDVTRNYSIKYQEGQLVVFGDGQPEGGNGMPEGQGVGSSEEKGNDSGEGEGDGEGDGKGDLNEDGGLGGGPGDKEGDSVLVMRVMNDRSGKIYMRFKSFGDYIFNGFAPAEDYSGYLIQTKDEADGAPRSTFGLNYLSGVMLASTGRRYNTLKVELTNTTQYLLPYYQTTDEFICSPQSSDVKYAGGGNKYTVNYYGYDYAADYGFSLRSAVIGRYAAIEKDYRKFVHDKYLSVPDTTREYLDSVISAQGFTSLEGGALVSAVAGFVQSAAEYDGDYDRTLDSEDDVVVAFLDKYKSGVCRHYSATAALLYRALGIPARYCIGYAVDTVADEWVDVISDETAHAWVEVYIDGYGWYNVEVTGGDSAGGDSGFGDPSSDNKLNIKPFDRYLANGEFVKNGGKPFTYDGDRLQGLTALEDAGYSYNFTVLGAASEVGVVETRIVAFALFDPAGQNVTNDYDITAKPGKLQIYLEELKVITASRSKVFDGTPLTASADDYSLDGKLLSGHKVETVVMTGVQRNAGQCYNVCRLVITDGRGNNVTDIYKITDEFGTLTVTPRPIVIKTGSAMGVLSELGGLPLRCEDYELACELGNALIEGDEITVEFSGYQSTVGQSKNTVSAVTVTSGELTVTRNYAITYEYGTLTVLPFPIDIGTSAQFRSRHLCRGSD